MKEIKRIKEDQLGEEVASLLFENDSLLFRESEYNESGVSSLLSSKNKFTGDHGNLERSGKYNYIPTNPNWVSERLPVRKGSVVRYVGDSAGYWAPVFGYGLDIAPIPLLDAGVYANGEAIEIQDDRIEYVLAWSKPTLNASLSSIGSLSDSLGYIRGRTPASTLSVKKGDTGHARNSMGFVDVKEFRGLHVRAIQMFKVDGANFNKNTLRGLSFVSVKKDGAPALDKRFSGQKNREFSEIDGVFFSACDYFIESNDTELDLIFQINKTELAKEIKDGEVLELTPVRYGFSVIEDLTKVITRESDERIEGQSYLAKVIARESDERIEGQSDLAKKLEAFNFPSIGEGVQYKGMQSLSVKSDGTGDYISVQEAINSITDASRFKQYVIKVYDSVKERDPKKLYFVSDPNTLNNESDPKQQVALVILKDWVHLLAASGGVTIEFESPTNLDPDSFQYIQTLYPMGNSSTNGISYRIKGGRYAIHQESGGAKNHLDYHASTFYENMRIEHLANSPEDGYDSKWTSIHPQANGTTSGSIQSYRNVEWISNEYATPFYVHSNQDFDAPNELYFYQCRMAAIKNALKFEEYKPYFGDIGSGQRSKIVMVGCDFKKFGVPQFGSSRGYETKPTRANFITNGGADLFGYGNAKMLVNADRVPSLAFSTVGLNKNIRVIGGSALSDIFGEEYLNFNGASDAVGVCVGSIRIENPLYWATAKPSQLFGLPYRLGNCENSSKTLIVEVDGIAHTIVFNKNYMTSDGSQYTWNTPPAKSNYDIIRDINSAFSGIFKVGFSEIFEKIITFRDCEELCINYTPKTFNIGDALVRDGILNEWRLAQVGELAEGISAQRVNAKTNKIYSGTVALINKNLFPSHILNIPRIKNAVEGEDKKLVVGEMFSCGVDGSFIPTNDARVAVLKAVDAYTLTSV